MKQGCLDIGIIQAFMDGELDHGQSARVSGHIAICDACAVLLADAEDESAVVFPALEREYNTLVPTQRLWTKINDSIVTERENRPFWEKAWGLLSIGLLTPSMAAAASLLIVAGVVAFSLINRNLNADDKAAVRPTTANSAPVTATPGNAVPNVVAGVSGPDSSAPPMRAERADYRAVVRRSDAVQASYSQPSATDVSRGYMPGEESYVRTIASLSRSVDAQKDNSMRASERILFERDMAVVDDAINKMRTEVKKNPKNESAKQVLYSSYQNKIDLLNSVSQKAELVASLR